MNTRMIGVMTAAIAAAVAAGVFGYARVRPHQPPPKPPAIMPMISDADLPRAMASNYGFMSIEFRLGDVMAFTSNFADTARLYVPGIGALTDRGMIARQFALEGKHLAVTEFARASAGVRHDGRLVFDSGTYELVGAVARVPKTLDTKGRYWTRWYYAPDGHWLILSDSLAGVNSPEHR